MAPHVSSVSMPGCASSSCRAAGGGGAGSVGAGPGNVGAGVRRRDAAWAWRQHESPRLAPPHRPHLHPVELGKAIHVLRLPLLPLHVHAPMWRRAAVAVVQAAGAGGRHGVGTAGSAEAPRPQGGRQLLGGRVTERDRNHGEPHLLRAFFSAFSLFMRRIADSAGSVPGMVPSRAPRACTQAVGSRRGVVWRKQPRSSAATIEEQAPQQKAGLKRGGWD